MATQLISQMEENQGKEFLFRDLSPGDTFILYGRPYVKIIPSWESFSDDGPITNAKNLETSRYEHILTDVKVIAHRALGYP